MTDWSRIWRWYERKLKDRLPGFRHDQWVRVIQIDEWKRFLSGMPLDRMDLLEISPDTVSHWKTLGFRSYRALQYPESDITRDVLPEKFDVILAEHIFEHLRHPYAAARNVRQMLRDDGVFLITTPFLVRVHECPGDYTRWSATGLQGFLEDCGFDAEVHAWGNRRAVKANFNRWPDYGWGLRTSLRNEHDYPVVVWAYARKRAE